MPQTIFTVGHGNLTFMQFLGLVQANRINHIIDIRSIPYSRHAPWSNKSRLAEMLSPFQIRYTYFGHRLGGKKPANQALLPTPAHTPNAAYQSAIEELSLMARLDNLSLLCAESDPARCHRQHVIAQTLLQKGLAVTHILKNGALQPAWLEDDPTKQPALF